MIKFWNQINSHQFFCTSHNLSFFLSLSLIDNAVSFQGVDEGINAVAFIEIYPSSILGGLRNYS